MPSRRQPIFTSFLDKVDFIGILIVIPEWSQDILNYWNNCAFKLYVALLDVSNVKDLFTFADIQEVGKSKNNIYLR